MDLDPQKRETELLLRVAQDAFDRQDFSMCHKYCQELVERRHVPGVGLCLALYCTPQYHNADKLDLLGFVVAHADTDTLPAALRHYQSAEQLPTRQVLLLLYTPNSTLSISCVI